MDRQRMNLNLFSLLEKIVQLNSFFFKHDTNIKQILLVL